MLNLLSLLPDNDDGVTWNAVGIDGADVTFYGLDSGGSDDATVSGGNDTGLTCDGASRTPNVLGGADLVRSGGVVLRQ